MDWTALAVSLKLAVATVAVLAIVAGPLAYALACMRSRWRDVIEAIVSLPLVLPPTVVGFYLLLLLAPDGAIGRAFGRLPFTFTGVLVGSVIANLPVAVRTWTAAFDGVDRRLVEAAWCLGVSRTSTLRRVVMPLAGSGLVAGATLAFAHALGEFGVVLMLGGSVPGATRTLSIAIYDDVQALDYAAAGRSAAVLVAFAIASLFVVQIATRRRRR